MMNSSTDNLRDIFDTQVRLLHEKSKQSQLDSEDIRKLETLTRAWKTFNSTETKVNSVEDKLADMSIEDLLSLAKIPG